MDDRMTKYIPAFILLCCVAGAIWWLLGPVAECTETCLPYKGVMRNSTCYCDKTKKVPDADVSTPGL